MKVSSNCRTVLTKTPQTPRLLEHENLIHLRQVSGGQFGMIDPGVDLVFESIEGAAQREWERRGSRERQAETGTQNPGVSTGAKDGDAESKVGEPVAVGLGYALDQAVKPEPPQLIGHPALCEVVNGLVA